MNRKQIPDGFYHDSLKEKDVEVLNPVWAQRYSESGEFLKTVITMNPSTGLYKNDGELIAWVIFLETGASGNLQVKKEYYRKSFGSIVSILQYCKVVKSGRCFYGHVVHQNDASFNFSVNNYKCQWIGNNSWIGVKKRDKTELSPLWGHL